jgi:glycosyltransferase involved in cell wall biosynthesis
VTKFADRDLVVGYLGKLVNEKGIKEFVNLIPLIAEKKYVKSLIGDTAHVGEVKNACERMNVEQAVLVMVPGWIAEEGLPIYLSALRLLMQPTYHGEGIPTIVLEAMACGTPVLAISVSSSPDVITDEVTGFLLDSTEPKPIAERITMVLNHGESEQVADNAEELVKREFTRAAATQRCGGILMEVLYGPRRSQTWLREASHSFSRLARFRRCPYSGSNSIAESYMWVSLLPYSARVRKRACAEIDKD